MDSLSLANYFLKRQGNLSFEQFTQTIFVFLRYNFRKTVTYQMYKTNCTIIGTNTSILYSALTMVVKCSTEMFALLVVGNAVSEMTACMAHKPETCVNMY